MNRLVLSLLVENNPGVLSRVAGLFSRRGYSIQSLGSGLTGIWLAILISHIIACIASVVCDIGSMKIEG